jgi:hypothetical protein
MEPGTADARFEAKLVPTSVDGLQVKFATKPPEGLNLYTQPPSQPWPTLTLPPPPFLGPSAAADHFYLPQDLPSVPLKHGYVPLRCSMLSPPSFRLTGVVMRVRAERRAWGEAG